MPCVVICDESRVFGEALRFVLEARGWDVAECVSDPGAGVTAVARHQPDLYLVDLQFPEGTGNLKSALARSPKTHALVLTGVDDPMAPDQARQAGALGLVRKERPIDQILNAIGQAVQGHPVVDQRVGVDPSTQHPSVWSAGVYDVRLTPRESEVLSALVDGRSTFQLAENMGITYTTARTHIQSLLNKLGVHSKLEAVALATRKALPGRQLAAPGVLPPRSMVT